MFFLVLEVKTCPIYEDKQLLQNILDNYIQKNDRINLFACANHTIVQLCNNTFCEVAKRYLFKILFKSPLLLQGNKVEICPKC